MKKELMTILVCPVCKRELELTIEEKKGQEIISGSLYCPRCGYRYPITRGIPNLLPPDVTGRDSE